MTTYILRRLLLIIPTLLGVTLLTYILVRAAPGNAALIKGGGGAMGGHAMSAEAREQMMSLYGLDKPPLVAYFGWLWQTLHLNLGESFVDHRPVAEKIWERLPNTLSLMAPSLILAYLIAIPLGVAAAIKRGQVVDRTISFVVFLLYSIPSFAMALVLILFLAGGDYLNLFPSYGANSLAGLEMTGFPWLWDRIQHMVLPVFCLTYVSLASISRYARVSMLDALSQDFVRTARAKGLAEKWVIFRHALRNAMIPIITIFALDIPSLIGGAIIIEGIFSYPGMGQLLFQSLDAKDEFTIMGITLVAAIVTLVSYLVADILYVVVDPRISYE
jgi:peptide/nickel transport system permease protein